MQTPCVCDHRCRWRCAYSYRLPCTVERNGCYYKTGKSYVCGGVDARCTVRMLSRRRRAAGTTSRQLRWRSVLQARHVFLVSRVPCNGVRGKTVSPSWHRDLGHAARVLAREMDLSTFEKKVKNFLDEVAFREKRNLVLRAFVRLSSSCAEGPRVGIRGMRRHFGIKQCIKKTRTPARRTRARGGRST